MREFYRFSQHFNWDSSIIYFYIKEIGILEEVSLDKVETG